MSDKSVTKKENNNKDIKKLNKWKNTPSSELFKFYVDYYNNYDLDKRNSEFEIRFGTNKRNNPITKNQFDNTINKLKNCGFSVINKRGDYRLTISYQYYSERYESWSNSSTRVEINGFDNIQKYCKSNNINFDDIPSYVKFTDKRIKKYDTNTMIKMNAHRLYKSKIEDGEYPDVFHKLDINDYEMRINYKSERNVRYGKGRNGMRLKTDMNSWTDKLKTYRYIKRFTLMKEDYPIKFDFSIVKSSKTKKNDRGWGYSMVPTKNIQDSNVFNNIEEYEIELEMINDIVIEKSNIYNKILPNIIKKGIQYVLSGLQNSNYPIKYSLETDIIKEYLKLTNQIDKTEKKELKKYMLQQKKNFIGYNSISLELENVIPEYKNEVPNINTPYTVTEKADGERRLLYIYKDGNIYLIDNNMNVTFTGCNVGRSGKETLINTILDGELVTHNSNGEYKPIYLAFDIYFWNGDDYRSYPFMNISSLKYKDSKSNPIDRDKFRKDTLSAICKSLEIYNQAINKKKDDDLPPLYIKMKDFEDNITNKDIFEASSKILTKIDNKGFPYDVDGLIYTPIDKSIGSDIIGEHSKQKTWDYSFKWKPSHYNTIDFLVTTHKKNNKDDIVKYKYNKGIDTKSVSNVVQYKTVDLKVGFSQHKHGFLNPCHNLLEDIIPNANNWKEQKKYLPVNFYPTSPSYTWKVHECNIPLTQIGNSLYMMSEEDEEIFEDGYVVEFKFNITKDNHWQFIPIRVRHDKTYAYNTGKNRGGGNDYKTANSVWRSIHNPITEKMLCNPKELPNIQDLDNDVYYKRKNNKTVTRALRDFHNKYVKFMLITKMSKERDKLLDMSVGKAGDLYKWQVAKLQLVVGLDVSSDNINSQFDGACSRYLKARQKRMYVPRCIFLVANSAFNIKNGDAFINSQGLTDESSIKYMNALYGEGLSKDSKELPKALKHDNVYGAVNIKNGEGGFDIISNQFSSHYFFKNIQYLTGFITNISENCKLNGYFIGTCYDGNKIFKLLDNINKNSSYIMKNDDNDVINSITKLYDNNIEKLENNSSCLGLKIDVYQESINQTITEYLVNFEYFTNILQQYGFELCPKKDIHHMGIDKPIDSFSILYEKMSDDINQVPPKFNKRNIGDALLMSDEEKKLSFINNYFIFKKIRKVNEEQITKLLCDDNCELNNNDKNSLKDKLKEYEKQQRKKIREVIKYKKKITLQSN